MYSATAQSIQYKHNEALRAKSKSERAEKVMKATKQGLVTDVFINNRENNCDTPANTPLPPDLREAVQDREDQAKKDSRKSEKRMMWMVGVPLTVLAAGTIATGLLNAYFKKNTKGLVKGIKDLMTLERKGPLIPPNLNVNKETLYATYEAIRKPSKKKMLGAIAVFSFSSMALVLKNTVDGLKEIAVKQKSADIQRNYQEKMIAIETRSFAGKKQIIRHMVDKEKAKLNAINKDKNISFSANKEEKTKEKQGLKLSQVLIGAAAAAASVLLIAKTVKNLRSINKTINNTIKGLEPKAIDESKPWAMTNEIYGDSGGKTTIYGYLNEVSGHLYNMIMNPDKFTGAVFAGMAAVSGISYAGTRFVEANKEIQVKKAEADINLDMNNKLVRVELKNFMTKKNAAVAPLVKDYKAQTDTKPVSKEGLKAKYNGVLEEIKNGPPFVYD